MAWNVFRTFGAKALVGFAKLVAFTRYPAKVIARYAKGNRPRDLEALIAEAPSAKAREQLELTFRGSAIDLIDRFFPDKERHRTLRAQLSFAAVQSTFKGPFTPGSAFCLIYTLSPNDAGGLMKRVRGGMGSLCEALQRSIEEKGGEVRLGAPVRRILVENGRAVGVELRGGEQIRADVVVSNLDKQSTLLRLVGEEHVPAEVAEKIRAIDHRGALPAPALQAARPAALRRALRAPERRSEDALQPRLLHDAGGAAAELRGVRARRAAGASARVAADPDGDRCEPRARGLPHRDDLRLLLPLRGAGRRAREAPRRDGRAHHRPVRDACIPASAS